MTRLLMLVRFFPPSGGSGVQRPARLARYLPGEGIDVDVVTTDGISEGSRPDPELAAELPSSVAVTRFHPYVTDGATRVVSTLRLGFLYYRALRLLGSPDGFSPDILQTVATVLARPRPDAILASTPPFSNAIAGAIAASIFRVPWIADLRDPWSLHPWHRPLTSLHRKLHERLEARVLEHADHLLLACEEMRSFVMCRDPEKMTAMENGFDPEDIGHFVRTAPPFNGTRSFRLVFVGTVQRSIRLEILADLPAGFELDIFGRTLSPAPASARIHGYVSHRDAMRAMANADALVLELPPELAFAPASKTYEYVIAGPPVLAIVPPNGAAANLIRRVEAGVVVAPGDRVALLRALEDLRAGKVAVAPVEERRRRLHAKRRDVQARELAEIVRRCASRAARSR